MLPWDSFQQPRPCIRWNNYLKEVSILFFKVLISKLKYNGRFVTSLIWSNDLNMHLLCNLMRQSQVTLFSWMYKQMIIILFPPRYGQVTLDAGGCTIFTKNIVKNFKNLDWWHWCFSHACHVFLSLENLFCREVKGN